MFAKLKAIARKRADSFEQRKPRLHFTNDSTLSKDLQLKTSSMRRRLLKIFVFVLGLCALVGVGIKVYTAHRLDALTQTLQKAKEKRSEQQRSKAETEISGPSIETLTTPTGEPSRPSPSQASETRQLQTKRQPSACSLVYQKYIENRKIREVMNEAIEDLMELANTDKDMDNDPCVQGLTDVIDPEHFIELIKKCGVDPDANKETRKACMTFVAIGWTAFAEMEYRDTDPSAIPPDALHSKIIFRLADLEKFLKEAEPGDKEYLFTLMDQMHKLRPDVDYGTARDELIAELYQRDPKTWKDDYRRVLEELENENILRAIGTFYEGHGRKADRAFFEYVEGLVRQFPENQVAHVYKGFAHTAFNEWDHAAKELAEAERLGTQTNTELVGDLRKSIQEKKFSMATYSWTNVTIELPDSNPTN